MTCCPVVNTLLKQSWELGAPGTAGLLRSRSEIPPPKALWVAFVMTLPGDRRCELVTTHCIPSAGPVLPKGRHQCVEKKHVLSPEVGSVKGLWAGWQGGHLTEVHGAQWEPWEVPRQGPCCSLGAPPHTSCSSHTGSPPRSVWESVWKVPCLVREQPTSKCCFLLLLCLLPELTHRAQAGSGSAGPGLALSLVLLPSLPPLGKKLAGPVFLQISPISTLSSSILPHGVKSQVRGQAGHGQRVSW